MQNLYKIVPYVILQTLTLSAEDYNETEKFFISISAGSAAFNIETDLRRNIVLDEKALDENALLFDLTTGYRKNKNIFFTAGYQNISLDIININHFYTSINYQWDKTLLHPYIGALVGYGVLDWNKAPSIVRYNKELSEKSTTYGIQMGIEERMNEHFSFFANYQINFVNFTLEMYKNTSNIQHKQFNNLLVGVRYDF